ncbi:13169_t:CDS:2, partial [Funneliformis mosseae]
NNNANEIHNVDHWLQMVENWIKILDTENHLDNSEDIDKELLNIQ